MPRSAAFDGSFDKMPLSIQRAAAVPRDYYDDALCRPGRHDIVAFAWIAEPNQSYRIGSQRIRGSILNEWALTICRTCPVQWECATAAIEADERAGIWGDTLDNLRLLRRNKVAMEQARQAGTPVQVAVRSLVRGIS